MTAGTERNNEAFVRQSLAGTRFSSVRWVAETGSTNDDLSELARSGAREQVLITDLQTAGKGRRDRVWDAPSGSGVLMSILLRNVDPADGFWFVGAIALAAAQAIDEVTDVACTLKWPNDVMLGQAADQRKVAGVLAALVDDAAVVGIGINANWPDEVPPAMAERGTAINRHLSPACAHGADSSNDRTFVDRASLAADILHRAIGHLAADRATLRAAWRDHCSTIGQEVRLELEGRSIVGIAADIAIDGALQIDDDGVTSTHQVGDVVHLRPAQ